MGKRDQEISRVSRTKQGPLASNSSPSRRFQVYCAALGNRKPEPICYVVESELGLHRRDLGTTATVSLAEKRESWSSGACANGQPLLLITDIPPFGSCIASSDRLHRLTASRTEKGEERLICIYRDARCVHTICKLTADALACPLMR